MVEKRYLDLSGLIVYDEKIREYIDTALLDKPDTSHNHDDVYYTEVEIDEMLANVGSGNDEIEVMTSNLQDFVSTTYTNDTSVNVQWISAIAYGDGMYVAVDESFNAVGSIDGTNWNIPLLTSDINICANDITYGNNVFVAVGDSGYVGVIPNDGTEGTIFQSDVFNSRTLYGVTYGNGRFIAVGYDNSAYSIGNGNTWTAMTGLSSSVVYNSVAYTKGMFVAVGEDGYYAVSTDGTSWTEMTTGDDTSLYDVCAGKNINGDVFVFVGEKGSVYYTYDGVNIKSGFDYYGENFTEDLCSVAYGHDRFIAVGFNGACRFTTGARRWANVGGLDSDKYENVAYGNGKFVAVPYRNSTSTLYFAEYEKVTMTLEKFFQQMNTNDIIITSDLTNHTHDEYLSTDNPVATGSFSLGRKANTPVGENSFAVGDNVEANDHYAHAEGVETVASGSWGSHAEGYSTTASGTNGSHAEGHYTTASGSSSHAEGHSTTASGTYGAHAEGYYTTASGESSHAEGDSTTASGNSSHAEGCSTTASGDYSHAGGYKTVAGDYQYAVGKYNTSYDGATSEGDTTGSIFIVGVGTSEDARANAFRITNEGKCMGTNTFVAKGADYAEFYEWADGNPENEDRRGCFVTLDGVKIRKATSEDDYILGIISVNPAVTGNGYTDEWKDMYITDVFGERLTEVIEVEETVDENGNITTPSRTVTRFIINPEYDKTQKYIGRDQRKEWAAVGTHGQLVVVDDGTCEINAYCKVANDGTATKSESKTEYRVTERLDDTHIRIVIK